MSDSLVSTPTELPAADHESPTGGLEGTSPSQAARQGWLAAWCDPEFVPFVLIMLVPAAIHAGLGYDRSAVFFAGAALYLAFLKWLGWLAVTRGWRPTAACLCFPFEIFAGLAVSCTWFYLRTAAGEITEDPRALRPVWYSLVEFDVLAWAVPALHILNLGWQIVRSIRQRSLARPQSLLLRAAVYGPFALMVMVALWWISDALDVRTFDTLNHALIARMYREHGVYMRLFNGNEPIVYPVAFGAFNAIAMSVAPLSAVQAVNMQHVLLIIVSLFAITTGIALIMERPLWFLHSMPLVFLALFPLYSLFPNCFWEGTARQAGPALLIGMILFPIVARPAQRWAFYTGLAVEAMLILLTLDINPSCAPYVGLGALIALWLFRNQGFRLFNILPRRTDKAAIALCALTALLVIGCDQYYRRTLPSLFWKQSSASHSGMGRSQTRAKPPFSVGTALLSAAAINPLWLSSYETLNSLFYSIQKPTEGFKSWEERWPNGGFPMIVLGLAGLAGLAVLCLGDRHGKNQSAWRAFRFAAGGIGLWLTLRYTIGFLVGGINETSGNSHWLREYTSFMLQRSELLLLFASGLFAGTALYLLLEASAISARVRPMLRTALAAVLVPIPYLFLSIMPQTSGFLAMPRMFPFGKGVNEGMIQLVDWCDVNLPADAFVGLECNTFLGGYKGEEPHIYPFSAAQAFPLYSQRLGYTFNMLDPWLPDAPYVYVDNVRRHFRPRWLLEHRIRYFCVDEEGLVLNPGLAQALKQGMLKPFKEIQGNTLYEVIVPETKTSAGSRDALR
jgi:hypothetical protein